MGRLRESLNLPPSEQRHPVLMHAIYLWACFISRPEPLCQHEEHYLQRSLEALPDGLQSPDKVIDVIQASCLLSMYFLANGRLLEGSYHASAAAALTTQTDLGRKTYSNARNWTVDVMESDLKPPKCDTGEGEKILAFWQVYNLDRCWSVVLRKPCIIPDRSDSRHSICCPWPQDVDCYENVGLQFLYLSDLALTIIEYRVTLTQLRHYQPFVPSFLDPFPLLVFRLQHFARKPLRFLPTPISSRTVNILCSM